MKTMLKAFGVITTAGLALAGCGTLTVNPIVQYVDDTATTTAIKAQLATEAGIGSMTGVGVRTADDVVVLTGTVANDSERQRIERVARRIAGDNRVTSELRVAGGPSETAAARTPTAQK
jgi:osmotically-inducible protein OsmY